MLGSLFINILYRDKTSSSLQLVTSRLLESPNSLSKDKLTTSYTHVLSGLECMGVNELIMSE
jgi:hypothetical protein